MDKIKRNRDLWQAGTIIFALVALFILLLPVGNIDWVVIHSSYIEALLAGGSLLAAAFSLYYQLKETRKLQEAEFILNLNQAFVETKDYGEVYTYLESEYFNSDEYISETNEKDRIIPNECIHEISRIQISNYLTFFESIYLLLENKTIQINILNDLFGYRFFLAVHSELFQREKLILQPMNFKNIYYLEDMWIKYRISQGQSIFRENMTLEKSCIKAGKEREYKKIMSDKWRR